MKKKRLILIILIVFCAMAAIGGCGDPVYNGNSLPTHVSATPPEVTLAIGEETTISFTATGGRGYSELGSTSSSSQDESVARVNGSQIIGVGPGQTKVTFTAATSANLGVDCSGSIVNVQLYNSDVIVTVTDDGALSPVLQPMQFDKVGEEKEAVYSGFIPSSSGEWSIADTSVAKAEVIRNNAEVRVKSLAPGKTTLTYREDGFEVSAPIEVLATATPRFYPDKINIYEGDTFRAYVSFAADYTGDTAGRWSTADAAVATIEAAETSSGRRYATITAHNEGETTVTFTHTASGEQASATVTVQREAASRQNDGTFVRPPAPVIDPAPILDIAPSISGADTIYLMSNGAAHNQQYSATGIPAPSLSISKVAGENTANATFAPDGILTIPAGLTAGEYRAVLVASSRAGTSIKEIKVCVVNPPGISGPDTINLRTGYAAHSEQYSAAGTPPMPITISGVAGQNTANATIAPDGTLTIPAGLTPGTYHTLLHTQNAGYIFTKQIRINVSDIMIGPAQLPGANRLLAYSQTLSVTGGTAPYTYSISEGSLPSWLTLNGDTLSGTPGSADVGQTSHFTVKVTDAKGSTGQAAYSITVGDSISIKTTSLPDADATAGVYYTWHLEAESSRGLESTGLTYTLTGGTFPPGLSMDLLKDGSLGGIPTAPGTYTFTLVATMDGIPVGVPRTLTLTVQ
ncbi:Ig domain-containing protein [Christensenellaceae bacterium OttesenSCG-928-K19]|nr:Ig domain-containing protein [Christensenellaceae bacterium OttesenSCG-928-K19]